MALVFLDTSLWAAGAIAWTSCATHIPLPCLCRHCCCCCHSCIIITPQVCSEFLNTVILREPVPHVISIMAEVKYRYVRQMAVKHRIHSWQPTAWNLTWWETLGPALVGNYATRTLLGRESLCRSAANMGKQQLADAMDSLLSFDMVMTLGRSQDIDLVITTMLGWPARNFSSQPGARVREVSVDLATKGEVAVGDSKASKGALSTSRHLLYVDDDFGNEDGSSISGNFSITGEVVSAHGRSLLEDKPHAESAQHKAGQQQGHKAGKRSRGGLLLRRRKGKRHAHAKGQKAAGAAAAAGALATAHAAAEASSAAAAGHGPSTGHPVSRATGGVVINHRQQKPAQALSMPAINLSSKDSDSSGGAAAAHLHDGAAATTVSFNMSSKQLEQQAAVMLVTTTWYERQAEMLGVRDKPSVVAATGQPHIEHTGQRSKHGAHVIKVTYHDKHHNQKTEQWHSFPRHTFAFLEADVTRLEKLTQMDTQVYQTADLMFNLDTVWLQAMLSNSHYRKKLRTLAATYTSCGFAGMIPVDPALIQADEPQAEA